MLMLKFKVFGKKGLQSKLQTGLEFLEVLRKTKRSLRIASDLVRFKLGTSDFKTTALRPRQPVPLVTAVCPLLRKFNLMKFEAKSNPVTRS